nr:crossover junction endodeoxyribonuclease RuvC [Paenibacillus roseus]
MQRCGLQVTAEINATTVKRIVGGHGKAEKSEVADGVRRLLRLPADHTFTNYDESDAAAIVLAWLIEQGRIDG